MYYIAKHYIFIMKKLMFLLLLIAFSFDVSGQSKDELKKEIEGLKYELSQYKLLVAKYKNENIQLGLQINEIKRFVNQFPREIIPISEDSILINHTIKQDSNFTNKYTNESFHKVPQCAAITKKGTRCSRSAQSGSKYCWQHQSYESKPESNYTSGRVWHTGPRGGQYYINSKGNKVYKKR